VSHAGKFREGWYPTGGAVPCPRLMVWALEVSSEPHSLARHGQQLDASPVITSNPSMLQLGGLLP